MIFGKRLARSLELIGNYNILIRKLPDILGHGLCKMNDEDLKLILYGTLCLFSERNKFKLRDCRKIAILDNNFKFCKYIRKAYFNIFKEIDENIMSIYFKYKTVNMISWGCLNPQNYSLFFDNPAKQLGIP